MFRIDRLKHIAVALAISAAFTSAAHAGARPVAADTSDVVSRYLVNHPATVRPDAPAVTVAAGTQRASADTSDAVSRYFVNHPAASVELIPLSSGNGFAWGDASIGVATGFGLALTLIGAAVMGTRRRMGGHKTGTATAG